VFAASPDRNEETKDGDVSVVYVRAFGESHRAPYELTLAEIESLSVSIGERALDIYRQTGSPPALVHIHDWPGIHAAKILRREWRVPLIMTLHALHAEFMRKFSTHPATERVVSLERMACCEVDSLIAVSASLAADVCREYSLPRSKVKVIFNGLDASVFRRTDNFMEAEVEQARAELLHDGERAILYAGRLAPQKGLTGLMRSAIHVVRAQPLTRYLIAGQLTNDPYVQMLIARVENHPVLREQVTFCGHVARQKLAVLFRLASLVVVPSLYEPFGYAATEPMAVGLPVIATRTGGLAEIIEDEISGLLVPLHRDTRAAIPDIDVEALVEAQVRVLGDKHLAQRLGTNARLRFDANFSIERMISSTLALYEGMVNSRSSIPMIAH